MSARASDFKIELGGGITLSARKLWVENLLITANSGGGKSVAGRQLLEQCAPHSAMVVFDYKGEYWSLREAIDVIIVGRRGEIPLDVAIAPELARFVRANGCRVVVDLSGAVEEVKQAFVAAFADALLGLPDKLWRVPLLVYVSEAQMLAPEEGRPVSRKAIRDLSTLGRQMRICTVLDTQRLAEVTKAALGSVNNRMFGRLNSDRDLARATAALGFAGRNAKDVAARMKAFEPGWFFCEGVAFDKSEVDEQTGLVVGRTSVQTKTRHIDPAEDLDLVPPPPSANIRALVQGLTSLAAKQHASAPVADRDFKPGKSGGRRGASSEPAAAPAELGAQHAREVAEAHAQGQVLGNHEGHRGGARTMLDHALRLLSELETRMNAEISEIRAGLNKAFSALSNAGPSPRLPAPARASVPAKPVRARPIESVATADGLGDSAPDRFLRAVLSAGDWISRKQAAMIAKIGTRSSGLRDAVSLLKRSGMIEVSGKDVRATGAARSKYPNVAPPARGAELVEHWMQFFQLQAARGLLGVLISAAARGEGPLEREDAALRAGVSTSSSSWRDAMSMLRRAKVMAAGEKLGLDEDFKAAIAMPSKRRRKAA